MFRPLHAGKLIRPRAETSLCLSCQVRSYAISVQHPRVWPGKTTQRTFDERKTFLYNQCTSILDRGKSQPLIFLQHKNFKAAGMIKLRREVAAASLPKGQQLSLLDAPPTDGTIPQLNIIRSSIFGVALRSYAPIDEATTKQIAKMAGGGGLAVLSLPVLDPPKLNAILRALERAVPRKKTEDPRAKNKGNAEDDGFVPGRKVKRQKPMLDPELAVLGAFIEGRVFGLERVKDVAKLPTLDTLRAQIIGLLSSPAAQLASLLGEASGGKLARTLDGLKKGLEEGNSADAGHP